jgi:hypothetical protein
MSNFPTLRIPVLMGLVTLKEQLLGDPEFLNQTDCPYDPEVKRILIELLATRVVERVVEKEVRVTGDRGRPTKDIKLDDEDQRKVLEEIKKTLDSLNNMDAGSTLATSERIQIAKTKTGMLDQLLKMMERHTSVRRVEEFKENVIGILNDLVSEADRETFQNRMQPLR